MARLDSRHPSSSSTPARRPFPLLLSQLHLLQFHAFEAGLPLRTHSSSPSSQPLRPRGMGPLRARLMKERRYEQDPSLRARERYRRTQHCSYRVGMDRRAGCGADFVHANEEVGEGTDGLGRSREDGTFPRSGSRWKKLRKKRGALSWPLRAASREGELTIQGGRSGRSRPGARKSGGVALYQHR